MVVKRRLNCDSNGFDFPNIPKAPRSCRRKVLNNDDESQICAIDLLASLAGKLLEESESSSTSTDAFVGDNQDHLGLEFKPQLQDDFNKSCKSGFSDDVSKSRGENTSEICLQFSSSDQTPISECKKFIGCENKKGDFDHLVESGSITEEIGDINVDNTVFKQEETDGLEDVKLPSRVDPVPKLVCRDDDDDENYCKYYKLSNKFKSYKPPTRFGNRRIRRSLVNQYGRLNPKLKYFEDTRTDCKRKLCYSYNSLKHENINRRRRLSSLTSDGGLSSESVSNPPEKRESANDVFSEAVDLDSKDSHVKFSIKSFKIPELFVEVPETATVGSLKRTVMEAVTALLANGIRVGVLSQGKKVRDDSNTLSQAGLSCRENVGNLGFTLEPGPGKIPVPLSSEDPVVAMPSESLNLSERCAGFPVLESTIQNPIQEAEEVINVKNSHEIVLYKSDIEEPSSDSRALVPVSGLDGNVLDIVPVNKKSKRMELAQRRTRRPFSVSEVEGLVEAVEKLGTGRWRDVKLRAFENASHRTYVDLKDKWKTLVHTASISPQQRRGEPVPQDLLDRVLAAHRHWSQQQIKPNGKLHVACALEGPQSQAVVESNQVGEMVQ